MGFDAGATYIFRRDAGGWVQEAKLLPPLGGFGFGSDVAMTGDTLVVGSSSNSTAHFFVRSGTTWSSQGSVSPSNPAASQFGFSVALDGDVAVVGARATSAFVSNGGAAYVFTRTAGTWTESQELLPTDTGPFHQFGTSVALNGGLLLVGAPFQSTNGTVYTYTSTGFGTFGFDTKLTPGGATGAIGLFGWVVALRGGKALVGAPAMDTAVEASGAAYQFNRVGSTWSQVAQHVAIDAEAGDSFGNAVAIGRLVVVGAEFDLNPNGASAGAAYLFGVCP